MTSTPVTEVRPLHVWGDGVRSIRQVLGLTQTQLAQAAGTHQVLISDLENGRRKTIPDDLRVRIAKALDVDPYALFPYPDVEDL